MAKKDEFDGEKLVAALADMGYSSLDTEGKSAFLTDTAKCRLLVGKVQGEETVKRSDPVYLERYRKRAQRMVALFENGAAATSKAPEPEASVTEATSVAAEPSEETSVAKAPAPRKTKKEKTVAKNVKLAKASNKKASTKSEKKGVGVIDSIVAILQDGGGTVMQIAQKVAKKTNREYEKVLATCKIQMNRLEKPKKEGGRGLKIKRVKKEEGSNELIYSA